MSGSSREAAISSSTSVETGLDRFNLRVTPNLKWSESGTQSWAPSGKQGVSAVSAPWEIIANTSSSVRGPRVSLPMRSEKWRMQAESIPLRVFPSLFVVGG